MNVLQSEEVVQSRVATLVEHLATIRSHQEKIVAENKRLREVVRLADSELRKRREQIERMQLEFESLTKKRLEAKIRIEDVMEKVDVLAEQAGHGQ